MVNSATKCILGVLSLVFGSSVLINFTYKDTNIQIEKLSELSNYDTTFFLHIFTIIGGLIFCTINNKPDDK